jgi:hypothetical protein
LQNKALQNLIPLGSNPMKSELSSTAFLVRVKIFEATNFKGQKIAKKLQFESN